MWWEPIPWLSSSFPPLPLSLWSPPVPHPILYPASQASSALLQGSAGPDTGSVFAQGTVEEIWELQTHHLPQECICCSSITTICCLSFKGKEAFNYPKLKPAHQWLLQRGGLTQCRTGQGDTWQGPYKHTVTTVIGVFMPEAGSNCKPTSWSFVSLMGTLQSLFGIRRDFSDISGC